MKPGLVSIIMPVWNGQAWVGDAIQSVLEQSYSQWELIIIENGSTDQSTSVIQSFSDSRIQLIQTPHTGVSAARNVGLGKIQGEFLCFLDCDDRLPPKSIESRLELFSKNPELDFVDGVVRKYNDDLTILHEEWMSHFEGNPLSLLLSLSDACFKGITWMIRTEKLGDTKFREDQSHSEDLVFFADLAQKCRKYAAVEAPTYDIRVRSGSAMSNLNGLAKGYEYAFQNLRDISSEQDWEQTYRHRVRRILFRSYLKKGNLLAALQSWFKWS